MNNNRCVACGAIIPEGRQVCPNCEKSSPKINDKQLVFICSPFHSYDEMQKLCNIENAKTYCRIASRQGYIPIAPHLFFPQFLNDDNPTERAAGIEMGKQLMQKCSKVWVFGNIICTRLNRLWIGKLPQTKMMSRILRLTPMFIKAST